MFCKKISQHFQGLSRRKNRYLQHRAMASFWVPLFSRVFFIQTSTLLLLLHSNGRSKERGETLVLCDGCLQQCCQMIFVDLNIDNFLSSFDPLFRKTDEIIFRVLRLLHNTICESHKTSANIVSFCRVALLENASTWKNEPLSGNSNIKGLASNFTGNFTLLTQPS